MFKKYSASNIVIFDGAMGTAIQNKNLPDNVWHSKYGCNEYLNLTASNVIGDIHRAYFEAGADVAVTNTFGAISSVLAEYGLENKVGEINKKAVEIARAAAVAFENKFIGLSVGPGTKLATLGQTSYGALYSQYAQQVESVVDDIDIFCIETAQDILQMRAAVNACFDTAKKSGRDIPILVSFTVEDNNAQLTGSSVQAVAACMRRLPIFALGLNCALGPDLLERPLAELSECWGGNLYLSPNAGMPESVDGKTIYPMDADKFSAALLSVMDKYPVSLIGGCCGTDTTHVKALSAFKARKRPENKIYAYNGEASSLYSPQSLTQEPAPALIGERANATGSKAFRDMLLAEDVDAIVALCRKQEEESAHFIDLSLAYAGRNEMDDYQKIVPKLNTALRTPLVIDSTDVEVIKNALLNYSGKSIINSVNFEDGGKKLRKVLSIVKHHPACVVGLTIDEDGMAQDADKKFNIAKRLYDVWVNEYNFPPEDLIIDSLTFSIGSGDESLKTSAKETIEAIKRIKKELKGVKTTLGVSNISFGLSQASRPILNSVFLAEAVAAGLDMAIVHASKLVTVSDSDEVRSKCMALINAEDGALETFINFFSNHSEEAKVDEVTLSAPDALRQKVMKGDKSNIAPLVDAVLETHKPEDIINGILFPAMQQVGVLFGEGKMLLPFVLQSAETMKAAVGLIEPHMQKAEGANNGTIVLATVAGDVHDIGKNLVDIILTNNGYKVYNIGIKIPASEIIAKAKEVNADAIGMSGLLVKSTLVMKENIEQIAAALPNIKVMLGGAALTPKFVDESCSPIMPDKVYYCKDAFDNIDVMKNTKKPSKARIKIEMGEFEYKPEAKIQPDNIPTAPFYGTKVLDNIRLEEIFEYINKQSLFSNAWGYKRKGSGDSEYDVMIQKVVIPEYNALKEKLLRDNSITPKAVYGYFKARRGGNAIEVYSAEGGYPLCVFNFPKRKSPPYNTLADFIIDDFDKFDVFPIQLVTLGDAPAAYLKKLLKADNYKDYYMAHGMFTELTEAFAELIHKRIRTELKIADKDAKSLDGIFSGKYRGKRYSFGYPLAPDIEHNETIASMLGAERIGVHLSSIYEMTPEYTTSAFIIHHSLAGYKE